MFDVVQTIASLTVAAAVEGADWPTEMHSLLTVPDRREIEKISPDGATVNISDHAVGWKLH